jgi:hypothetical protein
VGLSGERRRLSSIEKHHKNNEKILYLKKLATVLPVAQDY